MFNSVRVALACAAVATASIVQPAQAADEPITVIARLQASPGREAELEARLAKLQEFVHKVEPSTTYFFLRSTKTPGLFLSYEIYPNKAAAGEHMKVTLPASNKELGPAAEGLLARPMEYELLQPLTN